jgi:Na+/phosphate symporter
MSRPNRITDAMPFIVNPVFVSGEKSLDHFCRRKEVEALEALYDNVLFNLQIARSRLKNLDAAAAMRIAELEAQIEKMKCCANCGACECDGCDHYKHWRPRQ